MTNDTRYLVALQEERLTRAAAQSLRAFVRQAWPILEPVTVYQASWHIDLICEYLEAITASDCRRVVFNVPPRYTKSLLGSVLWPVWEWIRHPETRWVFASYAESLAIQHSLDRRTVLQSPWYHARWGDRVHLTDQIEKTEFRNTRRGRMLATSVGGAVTGKGGAGNDFVVGLVAGRRGPNIYIVDRHKAQEDFPQTLASIRRMSQRYPEARTILIEDAANGPPAVATLRREISGIIPVMPTGGKIERAAACAPMIESGHVFLPRPATPNGQPIPERAWVEDLVEQCAVFPRGGHDDDVDAVTLLLWRWRRPPMPPGMMRRILRAGRGVPPRPRF